VDLACPGHGVSDLGGMSVTSAEKEIFPAVERNAIACSGIPAYVAYKSVLVNKEVTLSSRLGMKDK
jgi:hypothetical protein